MRAIPRLVGLVLVAAGLAFATPAVAAGQAQHHLTSWATTSGGSTSAYHRGMMAGKTPNLDRLAAPGMRFTDYYAEASCTAGRANFITGELPIGTGMTTVGQAGAKVGMPAQVATIATALKSMGYCTGQFGKNHLGDLNEFLPTVHGFDEFFGYLYHLDAMEDPSHPELSAGAQGQGWPANMIHSWATERMIRPNSRAGARSASRRSRTPARSIPSAWRRWTTRSSVTR